MPTKQTPALCSSWPRPICLLHKNLANKIVPIAIQVRPGPVLILGSSILSSQGSGEHFLGGSKQTSRRERQQSCLESPA